MNAPETVLLDNFRLQYEGTSKYAKSLYDSDDMHCAKVAVKWQNRFCFFPVEVAVRFRLYGSLVYRQVGGGHVDGFARKCSSFKKLTLSTILLHNSSFLIY
jgi:hypothetical protein